MIFLHLEIFSNEKACILFIGIKKHTCTDLEVAVESVEPIDEEEWDRVI
jgi:hypothetical protein